MENNTNKYVAVSYRLYTQDGDGRHLVEETKEGQPFTFISGFGLALDAFEAAVVPLATDDDFSFTLTREQAYGDYHDDYVLSLDRDMFVIDGKFDYEHIYKNAIIPLQNEEGTRFNGRVLDIGDQKVTVDLNHPLAGEELHFEGKVVESREATKAEIDSLIKRMTGGCGGCGGGCCGDGCGDCGDGCSDGCSDGCGCQ